MRPVPQHIYDRAALLSHCHEQQIVAQLIGKDEAFVSRMKSRGWKAKTYPRRPRPGDFSIMCRRMGKRALQSHYGAGWSTVERWLREEAQR